LCSVLEYILYWTDNECIACYYITVYYNWLSLRNQKGHQCYFTFAQKLQSLNCILFKVLIMTQNLHPCKLLRCCSHPKSLHGCSQGNLQRHDNYTEFHELICKLLWMERDRMISYITFLPLVKKPCYMVPPSDEVCCRKEMHFFLHVRVFG
jgi:hypothetical protein